MTLALGIVNHIEGFSAEELPLLAVGGLGRESGGVIDVGGRFGVGREVGCLEGGDLSGGAGGVEAGHLSVSGGVAPCPLIMGYTPAIWQAPRRAVHKSSKENPHLGGGSPARLR